MTWVRRLFSSRSRVVSLVQGSIASSTRSRMVSAAPTGTSTARSAAVTAIETAPWRALVTPSLTCAVSLFGAVAVRGLLLVLLEVLLAVAIVSVNPFGFVVSNFLTANDVQLSKANTCLYPGRHVGLHGFPAAVGE